MGLSSSPLDREAIVLVRYFVRLKIVDPSGSISLGRLWAAREPDILRRPQAYSRYRELCIPPASVARSTSSDDVGSTCRQIEANQSPHYTAAAARVLCYRVRPTIRYTDGAKLVCLFGYSGWLERRRRASATS